MFAVIALPRSVLKLFWHLAIQHADALWISDGHAALIVGTIYYYFSIVEINTNMGVGRGRWKWVALHTLAVAYW